MIYISATIYTFLFTVTLLTASVVKGQTQSTRDITINDFTALHVYSGIQVFLTQGNNSSARVVADESLVDAVVVEQQGSNININWKPIRSSKKIWLNRTARVYLTSKQLSLIESADGSTVTTENTLKGDGIEFAVSSGAIIRADVDCSELNLRNNSGASAIIKGRTERLNLDGSSGSTTNTLELAAENAKVSGSSGAAITLAVDKELQVSASTGSRIRYRGNAEVQNLSPGKSGTVKKIE